MQVRLKGGSSIVAARVSIAAVVLLLLARHQRLRLPHDWWTWRAYFVQAALLNFVHVDQLGRAVHRQQPGERPDASMTAGLALVLGGVATLVGRPIAIPAEAAVHVPKVATALSYFRAGARCHASRSPRVRCRYACSVASRPTYGSNRT